MADPDLDTEVFLSPEIWGHAAQKVIKELEGIQPDLQRVECPTTLLAIERFIERYKNKTEILQHELERALLDIEVRLIDEMSARTFFHMPPASAGLYENPLRGFSSKALAAFHDGAEDLEEAAKCLASGRYTAAVFHLMRAMEVAVQRMAQQLGCVRVDKVWGNLLSDMDVELKKLPSHSERAEWSEIRSSLWHVKEAWRNNVMHPKQKYDEEQAREIFSAVRVFMNNLARKVT